MCASDLANKYYEVIKAIMHIAEDISHKSDVLTKANITNAKKGLVAIHNMTNPSLCSYQQLPDEEAFQLNSLASTTLRDAQGEFLNDLRSLLETLSQESMQTALQEMASGNNSNKLNALGNFSEACRKAALALSPVTHAFYDLQIAAKAENEVFLSSIALRIYFYTFLFSGANKNKCEKVLYLKRL